MLHVHIEQLPVFLWHICGSKTVDMRCHVFVSCYPINRMPATDVVQWVLGIQKHICIVFVTATRSPDSWITEPFCGCDNIRRKENRNKMIVTFSVSMLQLNQLYTFPLQIWNSRHMTLFLMSPSFVLKNGRISGIVARAINFTPSTQLWVLLNTIKLALAVRRWLSTDFD